jgi:hypothetical protein
MKFTNMHLTIDTDKYYLDIHLDIFQIYLIWFRLRIFLQGLKINYKLKNREIPFLKREMSKSEFIDMFGNINF